MIKSCDCGSLSLSSSKYRMVPYSPFFFWSCLYWWNLSINRVAVTHAFQYAARTQADNLLFWFWSTWVLHSLHCSWLHHAPSALPHKNQRSSVLLCFYAFFCTFKIPPLGIFFSKSLVSSLLKTCRGWDAFSLINFFNSARNVAVVSSSARPLY